MIARALVVVALLGGVAFAKPRVAVVGDAAAAKDVKKAIGSKVTLVDASGDDPAALATEHNLNAVIVVSVTGGKRAVARAVVHQGADGSELDSFQADGSAKARATKRLALGLWKKLGKKIASAKAPAATAPVAVATEPAPAPVAAPTPAPAATTTTTDTGVTARATPARERAREPRMIVVGVDERPFWRRLRYNQDLNDRLRPSDLAAHAVAVRVTVRPLANARGASIQLRGERAVGVNGSRTPDGTELATSSSEWSAGLGYDLGLGPVRAGLSAAFGQHRFAVDDDAMPTELLPDTTYTYARAGLTVDIPLGTTWTVGIAGGYRHLTSTGDLETWFPRVTGSGIDASAGLAYHATSWLAIQATLDVRRYFFAMNPEPGDMNIAGGAIDQYLGGSIGLSISPR